MANTNGIKLFQFIQKNYEQLGISPSQSNHSFNSFNSKVLLILFVLIQFGISSISFFLFESTSIGQSADSFYVFLSEVAVITFLTITISKIDDIRKVIENCETFIQKS